MSESKSIQEINEKIEAGKVNVCTDAELWSRLKQGATPSSIDLDVMVAAFSSSIRGAAAMVLIPVAERGVFTRARRIWLNDVKGHPGPAPNERLGVVDTLIFADERIDGDAGELPAGTRLLIDLLDGSEIRVKCLSEEGGTYQNQCRMAELEYATMVTYNTFLPDRLGTLLSCASAEAPILTGPGSKMLLNGSPGIVIGRGSRNRAGHASLSLSASMFAMNPNNVGKNGDDVTISVAIPIAVVNQGILADICNSLLQHPDPGLAQVSPIDAEAGAYLKNLVTQGRFKLSAVN